MGAISSGRQIEENNTPGGEVGRLGRKVEMRSVVARKVGRP
jgi:hypothetical protein